MDDLVKKIAKEKCTFKEFTVSALIKSSHHSDCLFVTSAGWILGKAYSEDEEPKVHASLLLEDVVIISNEMKAKTTFPGHLFSLFVDQIIAIMPLADRDSFLAQLQPSSDPL